MLLRTMTTITLLFMTSTCGADVLDLTEDEMRHIARTAREALTKGANQCKDIGRKTVHARVHLSPAARNALSSLSCVSTSTQLACRTDNCACTTNGEKNTDDKYNATCIHTDDNDKTSSKTFTYSITDVATFEAPNNVSTTPPTDTTTPPDDTTTPPDDTTTPPNDTTTPPPTNTTPTQCKDESQNTLHYGELIFGLDTDAPVFARNEAITDLICTTTEHGSNRNIRCESATCECNATFQLNVIPTQTNCSEL